MMMFFAVLNAAALGLMLATPSKTTLDRVMPFIAAIGMVTCGATAILQSMH